jgi:hypothetical protein
MGDQLTTIDPHTTNTTQPPPAAPTQPGGGGAGSAHLPLVHWQGAEVCSEVGPAVPCGGLQRGPAIRCPRPLHRQPHRPVPR